MEKKFGIDVSVWQGDFNFAQAKAGGVEFVILRGAYSLSKDTKFERNYKEAKAQGLPVGAYIYTMAETEVEAIQEAEFLASDVLAGKQFELPIYLDMEDDTHKVMGKDKTSAIAKAFLSRLEGLGYWVGIYSFKSFLDNYIEDAIKTRYAVWVAQWSDVLTYMGTCGMWQFGGETNVIRSNKINGQVVDQNYMMIDYPTLIKKAGRNGFKGGTVQETPTVQSTHTVKSGDTLSGIASTYNTTVAELVRINGLTNANLIYTGQVIKISGGTAIQNYTVKNGENLSSIAAAHGTTWQAIAELNEISNPNLIYTGQQLRIK